MLWKANGIVSIQTLFRERQQAIARERLDEPGDLKRSIKTSRLLAAPGDLKGLLTFLHLIQKAEQIQELLKALENDNIFILT